MAAPGRFLTPSPARIHHARSSMFRSLLRPRRVRRAPDVPRGVILAGVGLAAFPACLTQCAHALLVRVHQGQPGRNKRRKASPCGTGPVRSTICSMSSVSLTRRPAAHPPSRGGRPIRRARAGPLVPAIEWLIQDKSLVLRARHGGGADQGGDRGEPAARCAARSGRRTSPIRERRSYREMVWPVREDVRPAEGIQADQVKAVFT